MQWGKSCIILSGSALFSKIITYLHEKMHHNFESSTCNPLKYKMGNSLLTYSINMHGKVHQNEKGITYRDNYPVGQLLLHFVRVCTVYKDKK